MTPVEIQHMNSERAALQKQSTEVNKKHQVVLQRSYALEIDLQKQLNSASNACAVYEAKATALGIINAPVEGFEHVDFVQEINGAAENPVPDCTTQVKPALAALRNRTRVEVGRLNGEQVVVEEKITRVNEEIAELREGLEASEVELEQAEKDNQDLKEVSGLVASRLSVCLARALTPALTRRQLPPSVSNRTDRRQRVCHDERRAVAPSVAGEPLAAYYGSHTRHCRVEVRSEGVGVRCLPSSSVTRSRALLTDSLFLSPLLDGSL